jgi:hypothetical protein
MRHFNILKQFDEPQLLFRFDQAVADPRDGLTLFGPLDKAKPHGIRWAAVGTKVGISRFEKWVKRIQGPVVESPESIARPPFPGFEAVFGAHWPVSPSLAVEIEEAELHRCAHMDDAHQRIFSTVSLFADRIIEAKRAEDAKVDVWCVVIPEYVYQNCRPKSTIAAEKRTESEEGMTKGRAKALTQTPSLFAEENEAAEPYRYELNFRHQLKARLLLHDAPTQIIRETTIAHRDFLNKWGTPTRAIDGMESAIAWTISTAAFYKAGGRPWKLGAGREGVCYVGLVFRRDEKHINPRTACCAAQMFLDSGDGVVFKGAVGPWYFRKRGHFHLDHRSARDVAQMCVEAYKAKSGGKPPTELFLHGRVRFDDDEWAGFVEGAGSTKVTGVRISEGFGLKLFRNADHPVMRGLFFRRSRFSGLLWTRGFVPRLRTYPGREVPNPLFIDVCRGDSDIETVAQDVLALTKLNYNACQFADGVPVTLKFAQAVGEILTAGPMTDNAPPLPFRYYI